VTLKLAETSVVKGRLSVLYGANLCLTSLWLLNTLLNSCNIFHVFMLSPPVDKGIMFLGCPSAPFVRSFVLTDIVTTISHEQLSSVDETYREYSLAPTDDLVRCRGLKVKVTAGRRHGVGIHVIAGR